MSTVIIDITDYEKPVGKIGDAGVEYEIAPQTIAILKERTQCLGEIERLKNKMVETGGWDDKIVKQISAQYIRAIRASAAKLPADRLEHFTVSNLDYLLAGIMQAENVRLTEIMEKQKKMMERTTGGESGRTT